MMHAIFAQREIGVLVTQITTILCTMCAMLGSPCAMLKGSNKGLGFKWFRVFSMMRCAIMG